MANFSLLAKLGLNSKGFQTGIDKAKGSVNKFGRSITKISSRLAKMGLAAASAAFVLLSRSALQSANAVGRAADRLGVTTDEFQDFTNAAKAADIQTRAAEMGLQRFTRRLGEAQQGGGELKDTLEKYNIAIRNSDGSARTATAVLGDLADAIQGAESPAEQLRIAFKAFDSEGADLVRILKDGEEGFKEFTRVGNEEFGRFEEGTIEALSRADKAIRAFKSRATIKVGELIAGEAGGAAIKELGFRLMGIAAQFGGAIIDRIAALGNVIQAGIGGAFDLVVKKFGNGIQSLLDGLHRQMILIGQEISKRTQSESEFSRTVEQNTEKLMEIMIRGRKRAAEAEEKTLSDFFDGRIKEQTNFAKEFSGYWNDLADEQRNLIEETRKLEKEKTSDKPTEMIGGTDTGGTGTGGGGGGGGTGTGGKTPEDTRGDFARELAGEALRKAANEAGKDDNIRFDRMADGGFQQFVDGVKGEKFTEEQMQKGLEKKVEKDPTDETLKSIEKILQGKFVNE